MAYDGCSVQMMDRLIDLTGQVNERVEELQRMREQSDRLDKLDKYPSSSIRRRRRSKRHPNVGYPRDPSTRQGSWAAMPGMMMMLQDPTTNGSGQQGPVSLSHFESTTCTSSPVCESDATLCDPTTEPTITTTEAARVLDGDPGKFSGSASVPGSSKSLSLLSLLAPLAHPSHSPHSSPSSRSGTGASAGAHAVTGVRNRNTRTSNTSNRSPRTASFLQMPPGPLSFSSPLAAAPLAPPAGPEALSSYPASTSFSYSSFPCSPLPPLPPSSQHTTHRTTPPPPLSASFLSVSSSNSQQQTSPTGSYSGPPFASPPATTKIAYNHKPLPIQADHRKASDDISSCTGIDASGIYSDSSKSLESLESSIRNLPSSFTASLFSPSQSSAPKATFSSRSPVATSIPLAHTSRDPAACLDFPPSTSSSATSIFSVTQQPEPAYLLRQKRQPTHGPSTSARFLSLQAKTGGPAGTDHTYSRTNTDSMPSATLPPPSEAPNDNFLRASFDGTTARNSHSSHSNRSPQSYRVNGRWRPTSARSTRSIRSSDPLQRRSPSPMFNPFTRGSRQRHADGVSDVATRSRSSGGPGINGAGNLSGMNPSSMRARPGNGRTRRSSYSTGRRVPMSGSNPPPPLTREEFEALPVAIQRKV
ncbi:hypothetical protein F503_00019 [Ophiostoma piceae UAMH 11346]|uniref:Uncharacterized protein n=1 Tax=Ophiostoma piceae (strain UAMH 11346) TaxID=1262450 RepID=S3CVR2_OPHP1|nr:hypothetical protein F503_00019 [Ophiostoma piceae UAMH 11346]